MDGVENAVGLLGCVVAEVREPLTALRFLVRLGLAPITS